MCNIFKENDCKINKMFFVHCDLSSGHFRELAKQNTRFPITNLAGQLYATLPGITYLPVAIF